MAGRDDRSKKIIVFTFAVLIVAGLVWAYYNLLDWKQKEENLGYSKEAQKNPWLAASLFLDRQSISFERKIALAILDNLGGDASDIETPGNEDTLILVNSRGVIRGPRFENLWRWVENGGTLITSYENPFIGDLLTEDDLFQALGVYVIEQSPKSITNTVKEVLEELNHPQDVDDSDPLHDDEQAENVQDGENNREQKIPSETSEDDSETFVFSDALACRKSVIDYPFASGEDVKAHAQGTRFIEYDDYDPQWVATRGEDEYEQIISASFPVGEGEIVVLQSTTIWRNQFIQCHDHAYLLWSLVNLYGKVWLLENRDAPSLFALMLNYLPYAFLSFCLLLVLFVWSALTRFGPVFSSEQLSRRSFAEHIKASGTLLWKHRKYSLLIAELRASVEHIMSRRVVGFGRKSENEKLEHVAEFTRIEPELIRDALFKKEIKNLNQFIEFVKVLKKIKDAI